jgi:hypothetical protein
MNLLVIEKHEGYGIFPIFKKGTAVNNIKADTEYPSHSEAIWGTGSNPHWISCVINGYETFVPDLFVYNGVLTQDYNPTELVVEKGQIISLVDIIFEWLYVIDNNGKKGWIPANKVISTK